MARVAALVGDPARAAMLARLLDGRAHTPTELALDAGIAASTASGHLAQLREGRLVTVAAQGRRRYYRLASPEVARVLEGLMTLGGEAPERRRATPRVPVELREARTCYDHLAGRLGVAVADALAARGHVALEGGTGVVTGEGMAWLGAFGVELDVPGRSRRPLCRPCLDWSERRPHLAGALGAALLDRMLASGWLVRAQGSRALDVTPAGRAGFADRLGIVAGEA